MEPGATTSSLDDSPLSQDRPHGLTGKFTIFKVCLSVKFQSHRARRVQHLLIFTPHDRAIAVYSRTKWRVRGGREVNDQGLSRPRWNSISPLYNSSYVWDQEGLTVTMITRAQTSWYVSVCLLRWSLPPSYNLKYRERAMVVGFPSTHTLSLSSDPHHTGRLIGRSRLLPFS